MLPEVERREDLLGHRVPLHREEGPLPVEPAAGPDQPGDVGQLQLLGEVAPAWLVVSLGGGKLGADSWGVDVRFG
jgi:hypothetical protein